MAIHFATTRRALLGIRTLGGTSTPTYTTHSCLDFASWQQVTRSLGLLSSSQLRSESHGIMIHALEDTPKVYICPDCERTIFVVPFYDYHCIAMKYYWVSFVLPCLFAVSNAIPPPSSSGVTYTETWGCWPTTVTYTLPKATPTSEVVVTQTLTVCA
ncbi:hypothetical protein PTI98_002889 [Pleurotus ostreatus]|nr:hypothetical protein PTI98_002889 [Pleurotus ostreatus]